MDFLNDDSDDHVKEACGVVGVIGTPDASVTTVLGLHALQHRGEKGVGILSVNDRVFHHRKYMTLVAEAFGDKHAASVPSWLPGTMALGHNRYATNGDNTPDNIQPLIADQDFQKYAIAHNGNLTNAYKLRRRMGRSGVVFQGTSDSGLLLPLMAQAQYETITERFTHALRAIEGGYALVGVNEDTMFAARDPNGIRPLVLGWLGEGTKRAAVLASETRALDAMGATFERDVLPGEVVTLTVSKRGRVKVQSQHLYPDQPVASYRPDAFEYVYFAHPNSKMNGVSISQARINMGIQLAQEDKTIKADIVIPVLDSGSHAAIGYAETKRLPYRLGITRSHYSSRTFIQPTQTDRQRAVSGKHSIDPEAVRGKRVVVVDDSLVRGTTMTGIIRALKDAGALEVHVRLSSPMVMHADHYGIDMPHEDDLFAVQHKGDVKAMAKALGADSVRFLSVDGLHKAIHGKPRDPKDPQLADHVFTGDYPTRLKDRDEGLLPRYAATGARKKQYG